MPLPAFSRPGSLATAALLAVLGLSACAENIATTRIDPRADRSEMGMGLDARDFEEAAGAAVQSMLSSGRLDKPAGGRYVMAISRMTNDTMQRIDTDQLVKKIRVDLLNSGKVVTTTAVGLDGAEDPMAMRARELRGSREFSQANVAGRGRMVAPDLSLSGKILQRNVRLDGGAQRVDYYFQLTITEIASGLAFWENEIPISKRGSNRSVSW